MTRPLLAALALALTLPAAVGAQTAPAPGQTAPAADTPPYVRTVERPIDDVTFALEEAITQQGLVVDLTSHTGEMLARTKADVGGTKDLFTKAEVYSFCSAKLSRQVMEADITAVQYCPYGIFVYETPDAPGRVTIGHRVYPGAVMAPVNALLDSLVDAAAE